VGLGAIFFRSELDALRAVDNPQVQFADTSEIHGAVGSVGLYGRFGWAIGGTSSRICGPYT
jgi:hypothetical protein